MRPSGYCATSKRIPRQAVDALQVDHDPLRLDRPRSPLCAGALIDGEARRLGWQPGRCTCGLAVGQIPARNCDGCARVRPINEPQHLQQAAVFVGQAPGSVAASALAGQQTQYSQLSNPKRHELARQSVTAWAGDSMALY